MELELSPRGEPDLTRAVRLAVSRLEEDAAIRQTLAAGVWWRAGLEEAVERDPTAPGIPGSYEAARSPRNTRGATRA